MHLVDTHCHAGVNWFEPVEMLLYEMNQFNVQKAILTQTRGFYDNRYLLECMNRFPGRFKSIIGVDPTAPDALDTLEQLAQKDNVCGVRLNPSDRSPGKDPWAIWRKAGEVGLPISVYLVNTADSADPIFQEVVRSLPECIIVLEHLLGMYITRNPESVIPPYGNYRKALDLAKHPNTYIKFGGLGEFSSRPHRLEAQFKFEEVPPILDMAYEAFGPKRMMWGSDFPPVTSREGYGNSLTGALQHPVFKNDLEREWAFGKTAIEVWKLKDL